MTTPVLIVGWKAISDACGGVSRRTLLRWSVRTPLPIVREGERGAPVISRVDLERWHEARKARAAHYG